LTERSVPALSLHKVAKSFGEKRVLRDVSLTVPEGTMTALIGASASGKSVLLKCAAGLMPIGSGRLDVLDEENISDWRPLRPRIGILFQRNALFDNMSVWENVAFALIRRGVPRQEARNRAFEILSSVGLGERAANGLPKDLSGGMQKRAAFARAVAGSPELLLLDDPIAGLDPVLAASVEYLIRHMVRRQQSTALVVTSEVSRLAERFDRVAILDEGCIQWSGAAADLPPDAHPLLEAA